MIDDLKRMMNPKTNALMLGLCFPQAWMYVASQGIVFSSLDYQCAFHIGMCIGLVVLAWTHRKAHTERMRGVLDLAAAAAMCATPFLGLAPFVWPEPIQLLAGLAGGLGIGACFAKWFAIYSKMRTRDAFGCILLAFSAGAFICLIMAVISLSSTLPVLLIACALPICSVAATRKIADCHSELIAYPSGEYQKKKITRTQIVFLVAQIIAYAVLFGNGVIFSILQGAIPSSPYSETIVLLKYSLRVILPLLLFFWLASQDGNANIRAFMNIILLALTFMLLLAWFATDSGPTIAYVSLSLARNLVLVLLWLVLIKTTRATDKHPLFVFGMGRAAYELSVSGGILAYSYIRDLCGTIPVEQSIVQATAICVFVFLASCFFMTAQSLQDEPAEPIKVPVDPDEAYRSVKERYSLTEREYEIMTLLCKGHSKKGIAEILVLSENTIRWYTKQVYVKLNVHSKEALLKLVNGRS